VISNLLILVAILVAVLILVLGIGLGRLDLWDLAFAVWGVGFTGLGLVSSLSVLFVSFGTKVIVAFLVGQLILDRISPRAASYRIWPLVLGLLIYVLLASIPYLGWVIAVLSTAIGLGAAWLVYRDRSRVAAVEMEPVEDLAM
jgi:hypothetical protein